MLNLLNGDCLELMKTIPDKSIDMVLTDPPYGTTRNKWDSVIEMNDMWSELTRIVKDNAAIVLFSQQPFASVLVSTNLKMFRHEWIWEKSRATGHLNSKRCPMKSHENIMVFSKKSPSYFPQMAEGRPYVCRSGAPGSNYGKANRVLTVNDGVRYPRTNIKFKNSPTNKQLHPTQKPVDLLEYLINTYSTEGETVLDFTMGSGSTGVACKNLNRKFIGIEKDEAYFNIAKDRIENHEVTNA